MTHLLECTEREQDDKSQRILNRVQSSDIDTIIGTTRVQQHRGKECPCGAQLSN